MRCDIFYFIFYFLPLFHLHIINEIFVFFNLIVKWQIFYCSLCHFCHVLKNKQLNKLDFLLVIHKYFPLYSNNSFSRLTSNTKYFYSSSFSGDFHSHFKMTLLNYKFFFFLISLWCHKRKKKKNIYFIIHIIKYITGIT